MKLSQSVSLLAFILVTALLLAVQSGDAGNKSKAEPPKGSPPTKLSIRRDAATGKVILSWKGRGVLRKADGWFSKFQTVYKGTGEYVVDTADDVGIFSLNDEDPQYGPNAVYSWNVVGYVNVYLPPGLSLVANPLASVFGTNYTVSSMVNWWPALPDGSQVFKYSDGSAYEVSTFDGISGTWSNPDLELNIGSGFFFSNPSSLTVTQTFIGGVPEGVLVNPIPAGLSTKSSLVPQYGSINDLHHIPGELGDEIRTYVNDQQGGGYYNISTFDGARWQPDLILHVAEGFWINKQNAQNWVRNFTIN
jgi:hypothetical protein